jgi:peptide/nickel transport system ATP-binding protein
VIATARPRQTAGAIDRGGKAQPLLMVEGLTKHFPVYGGLFNRVVAKVHAVDDISFTVAKGEVLGIVGESGCGKSTTARLIMHLTPPDSGALVFDGDEVGSRGGISVTMLRRRAQMVFQDSYASLNPRLTIADSIAYAPHMHGLTASAARGRADELLEAVGLEPMQYAERYPQELSGGQRQRVNIARALALEPSLVILDEAVSALDKSVGAQVLNLLAELKERLNLTYIFISHDLNVVEYISDRVVVMYLGRIVETGPVDDVCRTPLHPYTRALFRSKPSLDPARRTRELPLTGDPPNPINPPSGCRFRNRCAFAEAVCAEVSPMLGSVSSSGFAHAVACHMLHPGSGHSRAGE